MTTGAGGGALTTSGGYQVNSPVGATGGTISSGWGTYLQFAIMAATIIYSFFQDDEGDDFEIDEITFNNFTRNMPVPLCYGTNKYAGTLIAIGETGTKIITTEVGGKGGMIGGFGSGGEEVETLYYYASFCVAFSEGEIFGISDIYIDDSLLDDSSLNFEYSIYTGTSLQTINSSMLDFFGSSAVPWRYTAYLYLFGSLGQQAQLPIVSAVVAGLLCWKKSPHNLNWDRDIIQENEHGCPRSFNATYYKYNYFYRVDGSNGNVYRWRTNFDNEDEEELISDSVSTGIDYHGYRWSANFCSKPDFVTNYKYLYCVTVRDDRYYDLFYINTETDEVYSIVKNIQMPIYHIDYHINGWAAYHETIPDYYAKNIKIMSIETTDEFIYLFGSATYPYSSYEKETSTFVWKFDKYTGDFLSTLYAYSENSLLTFTETILWVTTRVGNYIICQCNWNFDSYYYGVMPLDIKFVISPSGGLIDFVFQKCEQNPATHPEQFIYNWFLYDFIFIDNSYYGILIDQSFNYYSPYTSYIKFVKFTYSIINTFPRVSSKTSYEILWEETSDGGPGAYGDRNFIYHPPSNHFGTKNNIFGGVIYFFRNNSSTQAEIYYFNRYNESITLEKGSFLYTNPFYFHSSRGRITYTLLDDEKYSKDSGYCSEFNANPIAVVYDFMTNMRYGLGLDIDLFDGSPYIDDFKSWNTEYLYCEETILNFYNELESRYLYSNVFLERQKAYDIIKDVLQTCIGYLYYCDGKIKVGIEKPNEVPILYFGNHLEYFLAISNDITFDLDRIYFDLSEYPIGYWKGDEGYVQTYDGYGSLGYGYTTYGCEDTDYLKQLFVVIDNTTTYIELAEDLSVGVINNSIVKLRKDNIKQGSFTYGEKSHRERSNRIQLEYIKRDDDYRLDILEQDDVYDIDVLSSGEIREKTYQMPGIKRETQARRLLNFLNDYESIVRWKCDFSTDIIGMFLCYGGIIAVTRSELNWFAKPFRITRLEENPDFEVSIGLIEYISSLYNDFGSDSYNIPEPTTIDKFAIPGQVTNLHLFEECDNKRITIAFAKPEDDSFWVGAYIYHKKSIDGIYEFIGISYVPTTVVKLLNNITSSETTIYYDDTTLSGVAFPTSGSFWIEEEEIHYTGIDTTNNCFLNCERGYNNTVQEAHTSDFYCILRKDNLFYFKYTEGDVGFTHYFKVVSITAFKIFADGDVAPEETIDIFGCDYLPYKVGSLKLILDNQYS